MQALQQKAPIHIPENLIVSNPNLNYRQKIIVDKMVASQGTRDLYESAHPKNSKIGSGEYYLTYSSDDVYPVLRQSEVDELLKQGIIKPKYDERPDLHYYRLTQRR
jgi:hypothetical protein